MSEGKKVWTNSGRIFPNDNKQNERSADLRGDGEVTCPHCAKRAAFFMDAWKKTGERGPWLSLSFKIKDKQPETVADAGENPGSSVKRFSESMDFGNSGGPPKRDRTIDDDIPF